MSPVIEQWQQRPLAFQLGSIGAEVQRLSNWKQDGDTEQAFRALERALELLDATLFTNRGPQLRELLRLREVLCGMLLAPDAYTVTGKELEHFFLPFALRSRQP